jgi:pantoate--beta-alanine ligase
MRIVSKPTELTKSVLEQRVSGRSIALVPTMGNLHDGHLSLVKKAKEENDFVVVSIFVNPTQFGPNEDYNSYPRTLDADVEKIGKYCDLVFAPSVKDMYGEKVCSVLTVTETEKTTQLCGRFRPGHFDGVLTVVLKLFNICIPNKAYFGAKDYQQLALIKDMVAELNLDVRIIGCPIVRESDGLAMSSRNSYMGAEQRKRALALSQSLNIVRELFVSGEKDVHTLQERALELLVPNVAVQYFEVVDADTLRAVKTAQKGNVVAVAAFCDKVRLIDNMVL